MGRLERYAAFSLLQLIGLLVVVVAAGAAEIVGLALLAASLPVVFGWGHVQADIAFNEQIDDVQRNRWRIAVWIVPGAIALYWLLYVRSRRAPEK